MTILEAAAHGVTLYDQENKTTLGIFFYDDHHKKQSAGNILGIGFGFSGTNGTDYKVKLNYTEGVYGIFDDLFIVELESDNRVAKQGNDIILYTDEPNDESKMIITRNDEEIQMKLIRDPKSKIKAICVHAKGSKNGDLVCAAGVSVLKKLKKNNEITKSERGALVYSLR